MPTIFPVPTGRVSDLLIRQRISAQLESKQQQLARLQNQLSTGFRISVPSEDPSASVRGIELQRLLEQKAQIQTNVSTSQSYLNATDSALSSVAKIITDVRGLAVTMVDSTTSETERKAGSQLILAALREMVNVGNDKFRGRFLFSGTTTTVRPFEFINKFVMYRGNTGDLNSYTDVGLLAATNATGDELFGAISAEVKGTVDLSPVLTRETRLRDLNGGAGVAKGSLRVSDGTSIRTIDISGAATIGDVADLLEAKPPAGRTVTARVTATGLTVTLDAAGGGNLTITDLPGGRTAADLGILETAGTGTNPLVGSDLDPVLRPDSPLANIGGARAAVALVSPGANNDLLVTAINRGSAANGVAVQFVDDDLLAAAPGLTAGSETVNYSTVPVAARASLALSGADNDLVLTATAPGTVRNNLSIRITAAALGGDAANVTFDAANRVLTLEIDSANQTTLATLTSAINASGLFTAAPDPSAGEGFNGGGTVSAADAGVVSGNTGNSGGNANTIFVHIDPGATTANHVLVALESDAAVAAQFTVAVDSSDSTSIPATGTGGVDVNAGGVTAGGTGVEIDLASGLRIENGGTTYVIDFQGATTVQDVLNRLNASDAGVHAEINSTRDGINIRSRLSGADLSIGENGGTTATDLGVRSFRTDTLLAELNYGRGVAAVSGTDFTIQRNDGVTLDIDVSSAVTIGDVLNLINAHPLNSDPATAVVARLAVTGNGIELVDDNPVGTQTLTVFRGATSFAAWDLGLVPVGQPQGTPGNGPPPTPATARITLPAPNDVNTAFNITANLFGDAWNGIRVNLVNATASGDQAFVTFDPVAKTLTIDVDPAATTTNTVVAAITAEGTFTGALDLTSDPTNNGSGLVVGTGTVATTAGGSPNPTAQSAQANASFPPPRDLNTALRFTANQPGTSMNGIDVVFQNTLVGNVANVTRVGNQLLVDVDTSQTTANTVIAAVFAEGSFTAALDTTNDPTNDGSGVVGTGTFTTGGGTAEALTGRDVAPIETQGIFNTLIRLNQALLDFDLGEISRTAAMLEVDLERSTFGRASVGARNQGMDILRQRHDDEKVQLESSLSVEIDTDFAQAISDFSLQQATYEAALRTIAQTYRMSLMNFL